MTEKAEGENERRWEIRQSLVERLRIPWEGMGVMANEQRAEAAVQISTMMDELEALRLEIDRMVDSLTAQRDAARREVCELLYNRQGGWPKEHATERGWDCFKEKNVTDKDIVTELRSVSGFGWQCGEPLKDKGSYFRCPCGCSGPSADGDVSMTINTPEILLRAANEIERLRAERDKAKDRPDGYWWGNESDQLAKLEAVVLVEALKIAEKRGWGRFKEKP